MRLDHSGHNRAIAEVDNPSVGGSTNLVGVTDLRDLAIKYEDSDVFARRLSCRIDHSACFDESWLHGFDHLCFSSFASLGALSRATPIRATDPRLMSSTGRRSIAVTLGVFESKA